MVFSPDEAEEMAREGAKVDAGAQETSPDDFHGMVAAQAIVTARGGMTSHAAVVARGMGKTCVSGASDLSIDYSQQQFTVDGTVVTKANGSRLTARPVACFWARCRRAADRSVLTFTS